MSRCHAASSLTSARDRFARACGCHRADAGCRIRRSPRRATPTQARAWRTGPAFRREARGRDPRSGGAYSGRDIARRTARRRGSRPTSRVPRSRAQRQQRAGAAPAGLLHPGPGDRARVAHQMHEREVPPSALARRNGTTAERQAVLVEFDQDGMRAAVLREKGARQILMAHAVERVGRGEERPPHRALLIGRRQVHFPFRSRSRSTLATSPQATALGLAASRYSRSVLPLWP